MLAHIKTNLAPKMQARAAVSRLDTGLPEGARESLTKKRTKKKKKKTTDDSFDFEESKFGLEEAS